MKEKFMAMALDQAKKGEGIVNPNPLVGAVIVKNGNVVSKGYHGEMGPYHGEIVALKKANGNAEDGEMYVNLEPCCHFGKTPPCTEALIKSKIKKVYIGVLDPNPKVASKGVDILKKAGIEVEIGILEEKARKVNQVFFKYIVDKTPYITMKSAMSLDGKIATRTGESQWISGPESREEVHRLRNNNMGIMVGIGTVRHDNPRLDCRLEDGRNPLRIILDRNLSIDLNSNVLKNQDKSKTLIATGTNLDQNKKKKIWARGVDILEIKEDLDGLDLKDLMIKLGALGIDSILLEGGGKVNYSALEKDIVDKLIFYIAPKIIGGQNSKSAIEGRGIDRLKDSFNFSIDKVKLVGEDLKVEAYRKRW